MNIIGENIKYLRKKKGLTQDDLARKLGNTRAVIGSYEEGRAIPKLESLKDIAYYFNLSLDEMVNVELWKEETTDSAYRKGKNLRVLSTVVDPDNKELVTLIPVQASAGYTKGYGDPEYIEKLPVFPLPLPELSKERTYRIFQIKGDSMEPIKSGSYIICEYMPDWEEIKDGKPYIILTKEDGLVFKRVYNSDPEKITLKSDNPEYQPYLIEKTEILEVWKALGYISFEMPERKDMPTLDKLYSLVLDLQKDVGIIKTKV